MMSAHPARLATDLAALRRLDRRRRLLGLLGGALLLPLAGCERGAGQAARTAGKTSCELIPEETAGPFPGNGSNSDEEGRLLNALTLGGIVRSDIRASFGATGGRVAGGVPLTLTLELVDGRCAGLAGHAVYLWHCTADGLYSMYSAGAEVENFLRGVQTSAADGQLVFTTIVPGCYDGRMPHIHFEVYRSLGEARHADNALLTSQLTFPLAMLSDSYAAGRGYAGSAGHLAAMSYASDAVFGDGVALQTATVTGSVAGGFNAHLRIALA